MVLAAWKPTAGEILVHTYSTMELHWMVFKPFNLIGSPKILLEI